MNEEKCQGCRYFLQHYSFDKRRIFQVYCGHCTFSGARRKYPDSRACENFVSGTSDAESFVTKEYLSKELLKYVLNLDLLPEIEKTPNSAKKEGCNE